MNYLDEMFSQFSEAFLGIMVGEGDMPYRNKLKIALLDYSPESLKEIDRYLNLLYKIHFNESSTDYQNVIVWCGAYVGEVIRRNAVIEFHWVHYDDYMKDKDVGLKKMIPLTLTSHTVLFAVNSKYMTMPMNKIARWLDEGPANNIEYYASVDISRKV